MSNSKTRAKGAADGPRVIARNRRARHDYTLEKEIEAGLVLKGTEVKALREGRAVLDQAFVRIEGGEAFLVGMSIPEHSNTASGNHEPKRSRKLLLKEREIDQLAARVKEGGRTIVPLELYFNEKGLAKVRIALAVGRKSHDKRQALAEKDAKRQMERNLGTRR